ncbi:HPP family protein, partial [Priestia megaterium]
MQIEKSFSQTKSPFLSYLSSYTKKMKGELKEEPKINYRDAVVSSIGGLIAIIISSAIALALGYPMALAPIGASCVLVFGAHKGPLSQPRHVLGGHLLATVSALIIWSLFHRSLIT